MDELKALVDQLGAGLVADTQAATELRTANDNLVTAQATAGEKQTAALAAHQAVHAIAEKIKVVLDKLAG